MINQLNELVNTLWQGQTLQSFSSAEDFSSWGRKCRKNLWHSLRLHIGNQAGQQGEMMFFIASELRCLKKTPVNRWLLLSLATAVWDGHIIKESGQSPNFVRGTVSLHFCCPGWESWLWSGGSLGSWRSQTWDSPQKIPTDPFLASNSMVTMVWTSSHLFPFHSFRSLGLPVISDSALIP